MLIRSILLIFLFAAPASAFENDVTRVCGPAGVSVPQLAYRARDKNLEKLRAFNFGEIDEALALRAFYREKIATADETTLVGKSDELNRRFAEDSELKTLSLKYSSRNARENDPDGYVRAVVNQTLTYLPTEFDAIESFAKIDDSRVLSEIKLASSNQFEEIYGAVQRLRRRKDGKFQLSILLSSNPSEPLPYLLPLLAHEAEHARLYRMQIENYDNGLAEAEQMIVNEALAYDVQMRSYLAMAKAHPKLFCNWIYVSWSRGDLLVPLSANMAGLLEELQSGHYISDYAKIANYAHYPQLLNANKTALRPDLQAKINELHLKYVR